MSSTIDPRSAHERLAAEPGAVYIDVRSEGEFAHGHPDGAFNIPIAHASGMGMRPNAEFLDVARRVLPKDALIVVGCKSGQRSAMACEALQKAGYSHAINMAGGYGGSRETPGWQACGLPTSTRPSPGRTWAELRRGASDDR